VAFVVALGVALVATPIAAVVATRLGVVDRPGPYKVQTEPVPYLGGVAIYIAVAAAVGSSSPRLLLPLGLALALGVADDVRSRSPVLRIAGAVVVGAAAGWAVPMPLPLGAAVTAVAVVALLNALNLLDGLDGLAAGVALMAAVGFAAIGGDARGPALALAGALTGFLAFNRPPARIYLGDGGAYLIGTALALLAALLVDSDRGVATWAAVPLLIAVPVLDTTVAFVRRLRARRPLLAGDRGHVYDQLVDRGRSRAAATLVLVALQGALALAAVGVAGLDATWAVVTATACALVLVAILGAGRFTSPSDAWGGAS
jgi:UDP-GlcNAc:undecaprenyl-phosphate GlcNAc-1-phosphate transferase